MRILHLIYDDLGNPWLGGGGAARTREIYSRIAAAGHHVVVVCGAYPGAARREAIQGIHYRRTGTATSYIASRLTYMLGARRSVRAGGYDIVVEDFSPYSPILAPIWKPRSAPAVASIQNLSGVHASKKYGAAGWGPRLVERPALRLFSNFVVVSPGTAAELRSAIGRTRSAAIEVVPNGVDPVFFSEVQPEQRGHPYILFLGRLDIYQKGLDTLIKAFGILAEQMLEIRLLVAGGGTPAQERELRTLVANAGLDRKITLAGEVSRQEAARLMRGALFLAMPSRYEAWPLTALEAGASGIPVVGFDITGVRDAAPSYPRAHGLLVQAGNLSAFAAKMREVSNDPVLRAGAGERGREWAARFTWDALAMQQMRFYARLVAGSVLQGG